jgi:alpha-ketoglutarate-dependent 2,4-dichlorophenoxyacetate dioxygenase
MISVTLLHPHIGAEIRGVDLTRPLAADELGAITDAFNRHAVLVFPGQGISNEQQIAFTRNFGPLETASDFAGSGRRIAQPEVVDISNLDRHGNMLTADDRLRFFNLGNQLWHTDSTYKYVTSIASLLSAREVPPENGETEFADMRAAYDALPPALQAELEDLVAEHSIFYSRSLIDFQKAQFNDAIYTKYPPVRQVMVRRHPGSHRMTLFLGSHASHVIGWPIDKGRKLIAELMAVATQPEFVYHHRWKAQDLVMWDNRCTMHRARPYDDLVHRRVMHRTTVQDIGNTVDVARAEGRPLRLDAAA